MIAVVHDSFRKNAAHVDLMANVFRDALLTLDDGDLLAELQENFFNWYPDVHFAEVR